jgi:hypothetical protein
VGRGERRRANDVVELHVGLAEVKSKALEVTRVALALLPMIDAKVPRIERERDPTGVDDSANPRRLVQLVDVSDTGVGLEGDDAECAEVAVGDLVGLRLVAGGPLLLAKVVRRLSAATGGRVAIGLQRLTSAAQPVRARRPTTGEAFAELSLLYIPGLDDSGRHDAYLTSQGIASARNVFETTVGEHVFTFRFNRIRDGGRGWVMAGFEVTAARPVVPLPQRLVPGRLGAPGELPTLSSR